MKIKIKNINQIETDGTDFPLEDQLLINYDPDSHNVEQKGGWSYGYPIQIDTLIYQLESFKKQGDNYVSMTKYTDHGYYLIEALKIRGKE